MSEDGTLIPAEFKDTLLDVLDGGGGGRDGRSRHRLRARRRRPGQAARKS
jgi:hypothetical protein